MVISLRKASLKVAMVSVASLFLSVSVAAPVSARPTDGLSWSDCTNRRTIKTKNLTKDGKVYGTLTVYRCDNGLFARTSSSKKRSLSATMQRKSPSKSSPMIASGTAYQVMTRMVYYQSGACYYAHGYAGGPNGSVSFCL